MSPATAQPPQGPDDAAPVPRYDLVVSVGTDHHRFDRLLRWVQEYLEANPQVSALVQHGFTDLIPAGECVQRMPREQLLEHFRTSGVVLVQGGPGSILDARLTGAIPLAVPRRADLDEVIDDHQIAFTRVMAEDGEAVMLEEREELFAALDRALADPASLRTAPRVPQSHRAAKKLERHLETLLSTRLSSRSGRMPRRILGQLFSRLARRRRPGPSGLSQMPSPTDPSTTSTRKGPAR